MTLKEWRVFEYMPIFKVLLVAGVDFLYTEAGQYLPLSASACYILFWLNILEKFRVMNLVVLGLYSYVYQSVISEQCHVG
jgi:hypothetical protein